MANNTSPFAGGGGSSGSNQQQDDDEVDPNRAFDEEVQKVPAESRDGVEESDDPSDQMNDPADSTDDSGTMDSSTPRNPFDQEIDTSAPSPDDSDSSSNGSGSSGSSGGGTVPDNPFADNPSPTGGMPNNGGGSDDDMADPNTSVPDDPFADVDIPDDTSPSGSSGDTQPDPFSPPNSGPTGTSGSASGGQAGSRRAPVDREQFEEDVETPQRQDIPEAEPQGVEMDDGEIGSQARELERQFASQTGLGPDLIRIDREGDQLVAVPTRRGRKRLMERRIADSTEGLDVSGIDVTLTDDGNATFSLVGDAGDNILEQLETDQGLETVDGAIGSAARQAEGTFIDETGLDADEIRVVNQDGQFGFELTQKGEESLKAQTATEAGVDMDDVRVVRTEGGGYRTELTRTGELEVRERRISEIEDNLNQLAESTTAGLEKEPGASFQGRVPTPLDETPVQRQGGFRQIQRENIEARLADDVGNAVTAEEVSVVESEDGFSARLSPDAGVTQTAAQSGVRRIQEEVIESRVSEVVDIDPSGLNANVTKGDIEIEATKGALLGNLSEKERRERVSKQAQAQYPNAKDIEIVEKDGRFRAKVTTRSNLDKFVDDPLGFVASTPKGTVEAAGDVAGAIDETLAGFGRGLRSPSNFIGGVEDVAAKNLPGGTATAGLLVGGAVAEPTPFGEVGVAGLAAVGAAAAGIGIAGREITKTRTEETTLNTGELGIGSTVVPNELTVGETTRNELTVDEETGVVQREIPVPVNANISRDEISVPEQFDESEISITGDGNIAIPAEAQVQFTQEQLLENKQEDELLEETVLIIVDEDTNVDSNELDEGVNVPITSPESVGEQKDVVRNFPFTGGGLREFGEQDTDPVEESFGIGAGLNASQEQSVQNDSEIEELIASSVEASPKDSLFSPISAEQERRKLAFAPQATLPTTTETVKELLGQSPELDQAADAEAVGINNLTATSNAQTLGEVTLQELALDQAVGLDLTEEFAEPFEYTQGYETVTVEETLEQNPVEVITEPRDLKKRKKLRFDFDLPEHDNDETLAGFGGLEAAEFKNPVGDPVDFVLGDLD